jgi:hypothetical protein
MRNENYEGFHYIYRKETESFLSVLKLRLDAKLPNMIELGTNADMKKMDDMRLVADMSLHGELKLDVDVLAVLAKMKMEGLNREDWSLPPTPGTKRDAIEQTCQFLLAQPKELAKLPSIPQIWTGATAQSETR